MAPSWWRTVSTVEATDEKTAEKTAATAEKTAATAEKTAATAAEPSRPSGGGSGGVGPPLAEP